MKSVKNRKHFWLQKKPKGTLCNKIELSSISGRILSLSCNVTYSNYKESHVQNWFKYEFEQIWTKKLQNRQFIDKAKKKKRVQINVR